MKHPYEVFGMIVAGVCLVFVMALPIGNFVLQVDSVTGAVGADAGNSIDQYIHSALPPKLSWDNYYKDNMDMQLDCKKASKNLQEFYECVNNP